MKNEVFFPENKVKPEKTEGENDFLGNKLDIIDLQPENPKSEIPVLFAPGWSNSIETMKNSLDVLVENGRRVVSLTHGRKSEITEGPEKYPKEELQKALALIGLLEQKGIEKVDIVGYSEGGINSLIVAEIFPEKIRNIVLIDPAGMVGKDSLLGLPLKMTNEIAREMSSNIKSKAKPLGMVLKDIILHAGKNLPMSFREVRGISQSNILETMKNLKEKGIHISIIFGADDKVFPMEEVQKNTKKDHVDGFYSVKGGHSEIILHPQQYMGLVSKALDDLANLETNDEK